MKNATHLIMLLSLLTINNSAWGQTTVHHHHNTTTEVVIPSNFENDGIVYDLNLSGLRSYIEDLKEQGNTELARAIEPRVSQLESSATTGALVSAPFLAATAYFTYLSLTYKDNLPGKDDPSSENFMKDNELDKKSEYLYYAIGSAGLSLIIYYATQPSREDYLDIINRHNRKAKKLNEPLIKINLGLLPFDHLKAPMGTLKISWNF